MGDGNGGRGGGWWAGMVVVVAQSYSLERSEEGTWLVDISLVTRVGVSSKQARPQKKNKYHKTIPRFSHSNKHESRGTRGRRVTNLQLSSYEWDFLFRNSICAIYSHSPTRLASRAVYRTPPPNLSIKPW